MTLAVVVMLAFGRGDAAFCPSAPSPVVYQQTASISQTSSGKFDRPNSVQVASKLINTKTGKLVGWLYLDEHGLPYVSLVPHIDRATYVWFHMGDYNTRNRRYATDANAQPHLWLPPNVEIHSCTQKYSQS